MLYNLVIQKQWISIPNLQTGKFVKVTVGAVKTMQTMFHKAKFK